MAKSPARPFKVWNFDRSVKKSITASTLQELVERGCSKLSLGSSSQLRVVLEEDGTQVDEEDYFDLLPANCTFLFLKNNEQWNPQGHGETALRDEVDRGGDHMNTDDDIRILALSLRQDIRNIITFSSEQLQDLVDYDASTLAHVMGRTERYVLAVQNACQRHLDEQSQTQEAINLLKLYHQVQQANSSSGAQAKKRQKTDDSSGAQAKKR